MEKQLKTMVVIILVITAVTLVLLWLHDQRVQQSGDTVSYAPAPVVVQQVPAVEPAPATAASENANVFDTQTGGVIGQEQGEAGICKFVGQGKLICPGYPAQNVRDGLWILSQQLTDEFGTPAGTLCNGVEECELDFMNALLEVFGQTGIFPAGLGEVSGGGGVCEAWRNRFSKQVALWCGGAVGCKVYRGPFTVTVSSVIFSLEAEGSGVLKLIQFSVGPSGVGIYLDIEGARGWIRMIPC